MDDWSCYECLCLLNPFYDFEEDQQVGELVGEVVEDFHIIARDPMRAYYRVFDTLDMPEYGPGRTRFTMEVKGETLEEVGDTLMDVDATEADVTRCLKLYRVAIRSEENLDRREGLIKEYEFFMDMHRGFDQEEMEQARLYVEEARDRDNSREVRLVHYQRVVFHTHRKAEKEAVREEYMRYCREGLI
jgi:hypothetical protein